MKQLLYGVAYYFEYLSYDRVDQDIEMMKAAGINVVRIGESTWSTYEPHDGEFDFSKLIYTLDKMDKNGMKVIVGTPTYAFPTWLAKEYPDVLVERQGKRLPYGARQIMDITNPTFRFYAERIIRQMMLVTREYDNVIGYQVDNETKHYGTSSRNVQAGFVDYLKQEFNGDLDALNAEFGLDYWSNRINAWEDFPNVNRTINGSLAGEFAKYQRQLVTDYLAWQTAIVREYTHDDQFVTHNFDFEWRGYSYGVQPDVDHFAAAKPLDVVGIDVYHPSQRQLTGAEISFAGDIARSIKQQNYLVLETQAQAFKTWTPYPGQLFQLAFSHVANGANMVEYWHWHSIHNSFETYWKGLLSHDFQPNPVYNEAQKVGAAFQKLSADLVNLKHAAKVAFVVDNASLTATSGPWMEFGIGEDAKYNDVFRRLYDAFYRQNIATDVLNPELIDPAKYDLLVVPMLYTATDDFLQKLNDYVENGGHVLYTFKDGVANEHVKVRTTRQPGIISKAVGAHYEMFVDPNGEGLADNSGIFKDVDNQISNWAELLETDGAKVLATYDRHWKSYAAITENTFGKGMTWYLGCWPNEEVVARLVEHIVDVLGLADSYHTQFPLIVKSGTNEQAEKIDFIFNYSDEKQAFIMPFAATELLADASVSAEQKVEMAPWDVKIMKRG